jgi:hypothetical protein
MTISELKLSILFAVYILTSIAFRIHMIASKKALKEKETEIKRLQKENTNLCNELRGLKQS